MVCEQRSNPHNPTLLRATPTASAVAEPILLVPMPLKSAKKTLTPAASQTICQQRLQIPPRTGPMRFMSRGMIHVALSSNAVLTVRAMPTWREV